MIQRQSTDLFVFSNMC